VVGVDSEVVGDIMGGVGGVMESIPGIIAQCARLGTKGGKKTLSVKKKPAVKISLVAGDLTLSPSEDDTIRGNLSSGIVTTKDIRDELLIKCLGGDADVQMPQIERLAVSLVGGDVEGNVDAALLVVKTLDGDIKLQLKNLQSATMKSKSGDISITIPKEADAVVDAYTLSGDLEFEPKMEIEEQTDNHIKGKMGEGKGSLTIVNLSGDISVKAS
jgi:DUF4097 and DUF4098 domain-containing protein YvlB